MILRSGIPVVAIVFAIVAFFWVFSFAVKALYRGVLSMVGSLVTPNGHRRIGSYDDAKAAQELRSQGYEITPDWRSNAVESLPKS